MEVRILSVNNTFLEDLGFDFNTFLESPGAESVIDLLERPDSVTGLRFTYEPEELRFFQARFEPFA